MRRIITTLAALVVTLAACDATGNDFDPVDAMRLVIVSGDGQAEQVGANFSAVKSSGVPASSLDVRNATHAADLFAAPLVAELKNADGTKANPAPGTLVEFVSNDPAVCSPFTSTDTPDGDARVSTVAEKGTKAGTCRIEARRILSDNTAHVDTTFVLTVKPGPPVMDDLAAGDIVGSAAHWPGDDADGHVTFDAVGRDQYDNPSDAFALAGLPGGWLMPAGTTFGTVEARTLVMADGHGVGDTTTVVVRDGAGGQLCACSAEVVPSIISDASGWQDTTWSVTLRYRP